jgi:hypothetical protein
MKTVNKNKWQYIDAKTHYFINAPNVSQYSLITNYLFNGEKAQNTKHNKWFKVKSINNVQMIIIGKSFIEHYSMKNEHRDDSRIIFFPRELKPINESEAYEDNNGNLTRIPHEYSSLLNIYEVVYGYEPDTFKDVEIEWERIADVDENFEVSNPNLKVKHRLIDELFFDDVLLSQYPCYLTSEDSYSLIRKHIKNNIDRNVAVITSDFDFCLTVKKIIKSNEPEIDAVNVRSTLTSKKIIKKEKELKYIRNSGKTRKVVCFETAPEKRGGVYTGYTRTPNFTGKNEKDLWNNVEKYLNELMAKINEPVTECPHCNGNGVILELLK